MSENENKIKNNKLNVRQATINMAILAILTALVVVISMFCTIKTEFIKISLTFIPVVIAAKLYGAPGGAAVAGLGDIVGWIIRPLGPLYLPITITGILVGVMYGLVLKKSDKFHRVLISVLIAQLGFATFVTPIWLNDLYGTPYFTLLQTRIPQILIMIAIELIVIPIMLKAIDKLKSARVIA